MHTRRLLLGVLLPVLVTGQEPATPLQVTGSVQQRLMLSPDDLARMPRSSVKTSANGVETVYEGVWLHEILKKAGVPQGSSLRGKALASYVLAEGQDGYQALFSLAELDPAFVDSEILVADTSNGKALAGPQGRFRLVVPKDKSGPRSVRMLTRIEVVQVTK